MIAKLGDIETTTMVQLPSPSNNYLTRYASTIQLFASAMYEENPVSVILIIAGFVLLGLLLLIKIYLWKTDELVTLWKWLRDTGKYSVKHFKELFSKK